MDLPAHPPHPELWTVPSSLLICLRPVDYSLFPSLVQTTCACSVLALAYPDPSLRGGVLLSMHIRQHRLEQSCCSGVSFVKEAFLLWGDLLCAIFIMSSSNLSIHNHPVRQCHLTVTLWEATKLSLIFGWLVGLVF